MKGVILYFSGTGNTRRVSELYKKHLVNIGYKIDLIDISKRTEPLEEYDLYLLGSPTYSKVAIQNLEIFFDNYINQKVSTNKKFMTYVTHSWSDVYGHLTLKSYIEKKGYKVYSANTFLMPNGFYMMNKEKQNAQEKSQLFKAANKKVFKVIQNFEKNLKFIEEKSTIKRQASQILYKGLNKTWIPTFAKKNLSVNNDKCTKCSLCVKQCPSKNISLETGKITFSNKCLACAKCLNICPKNAFLAKGKEFEQFNTREKIEISS
ncbi:EFR1 family ferrodoxin [uncultured Clostridium sp.]|jgi:ferredoxin|uniref:EFR1 family ferrodoxin n=1 Tax=uncultured Clostridium sp. TaxID=59620 RepID=UPI002627AA3D|nr:EFR1 family ferrodoxin [uncultured Clostridium sp.]